jgi:hypothetical protein
MNLVPHSLRHGLVSVRQWFADTAERATDAIKDFLIDWGVRPDQRAAEHELPALSPPQFIEALRGRVEYTLYQVAQAINRAPTADVVAASEEEVRGLFGALWWDALELGARMRVEAALAQLPPPPGPENGWAAKYRRMAAEEGRLPVLEE